MNEKVIRLMAAPTSALARVLVQAEPEPLEIDLQRFAVIVIDMQNAFVSKGGMFDLMGRDITQTQEIIEPIRKITSAARAKRVKVIYVTHPYSSDLRESGGQNSPNWYKESSLRLYREHPEYRDKLLIRGTWGAEIVDKLKPQEGDIGVEKPRYSAFFRTNLDIILKTHNIKYLAFVGTATNICVETSIRDAFNLDYFCILISDAVAPVSPQFILEATTFSVKLCFGWIATTQDLMKALQ